MNIFGWNDYEEKIREDWNNKVKEDKFLDIINYLNNISIFADVNQYKISII